VPTNDLASESAAAGAEGLRFDLPSPGDGPAMWALAGEVGLDVNSPYAYAMWGDYFRSTSVVARRCTELVGFVAGFAVPDEPTTLFVWQIGVASSARRTGLGSRLLDHLIDRCSPTHLEATVTPSNTSSAALFRSLGARRRAGFEESMAYPSELLGADHEAELRFRIGPLHPRPIHETT